MVERRTERPSYPIPSTMISTAQSINQVAQDHWYIKVDKLRLTPEKLEEIGKKYQIPENIELRLPMTDERTSNARPIEFTLYEEALNGGLRLPLPQLAIDILNRLEVAPS